MTDREKVHFESDKVKVTKGINGLSSYMKESFPPKPNLRFPGEEQRKGGAMKKWEYGHISQNQDIANKVKVHTYHWVTLTPDGAQREIISEGNSYQWT